MKFEAVHKLALVLVVLVLAVLLRGQLEKKRLSVGNLYQEKVGGIKREEIDAIQIVKSEEKIEFFEEKGEWMVFGEGKKKEETEGDIVKEATEKIDQQAKEKADKEKVKNFLKEVFEIDGAQLVAKTNSKHEEFGLKEDEAVKLNFKDGDETRLSLFLGNVSYSGAYVRFIDNDMVFLLKSVIAQPSMIRGDWVEEETNIEASSSPMPLE